MMAPLSTWSTRMTALPQLTTILTLSLAMAAPAFGAAPAPACSKACKHSSTKRQLTTPLPQRQLVFDRHAPTSSLARDVATLKAARLASTQ